MNNDKTVLPFTPALAAECDDRYNSEQMEREYGKKTVQGFEMAFKAGAEWAHAYFADELRWEPIASKQAKGERYTFEDAQRKIVGDLVLTALRTPEVTRMEEAFILRDHAIANLMENITKFQADVNANIAEREAKTNGPQ